MGAVQAGHYTPNPQEAQRRYAANDFLSIDSNAAERAMRRVGIGTKNWLFAGHEKAAQRTATLYIIVAIAERHCIDPQRYLTGVLARMPAMPVTQLEKLLPERWKTAEEPDLIDRWQSACLQDSTWI